MKSTYDKADYDRQHYEKIISAGLCVKCRKKRDGASRWRCKACLRKMAARARERSAVWKYGGTARGSRYEEYE